MALINGDAIHDQGDVPLVQLWLCQNVIKHFDDCFGSPVGLQKVIARINVDINLVLQTGNAVGQVLFQFRVCFVDNGSFVRGLSHGVDQLTLVHGLELLLAFGELTLQRVNGISNLLFPFRLLLDGILKAFQDSCGIVPDDLDIAFEQLVQLVHADMVAGAAFAPPAVVCAARVSGRKVGTRHGEHRRSAVSAIQKAGVIGSILFLAAVVASGTKLELLLRIGEGAGIDDRGVCVLDDDMLILVQSLILAIDIGSGILFLPQRPYIKIIAENA